MHEDGLQFTRAPDGKRSSTHANRGICSAALTGVDPSTAAAIHHETNWRHRYPRYLHALTAAAVADPAQAITMAAAGLTAAWQHVEWLCNGAALPLAEAMHRPRPEVIHSVTFQGRGASTEIEPFTVPYRGQRLHGAALQRQIEHWEAAGIIEPGCARALQRVIEHPEWLDLSDRTLVLLGAGAEAGPLATLARWRATIIAVDVPDPARWQRIIELVNVGNSRLIAPALRPVASDATPDQWLSLVGVDLLRYAPEIAAWFLSVTRPLDIATLAYLDGERHLRVALAMDAIAATVSAARLDTTLMMMATPTDIFAVSEEIARVAMRHSVRVTAHPLAAIVRTLSGGRLLQPHVRDLIPSANGKRYGIVDCLFLEQGPNYAIAKRLQQWRALVARAGGQRVSINVAPATMTKSVIKNPALRAGYNGAGLFGVEIFAPETTSALMAALWVHDLRCHDCAAHPAVPLEHPLELLIANANHGGLWRSGFLPRTALPLAALVGLVRSPSHL